MNNKIRIETYDSNGNLIEVIDDRTDDEVKEQALEVLNEVFTLEYVEKFGFKDKEKGERKLLEARLGILDDKDEEKRILNLDKELKMEYKLRKENIRNAATLHEAEQAVAVPKKLVKKTLLGITTGYKLEDI